MKAKKNIIKDGEEIVNCLEIGSRSTGIDLTPKGCKELVEYINIIKRGV